MKSDMMLTLPAVFAVGEEYQIMVPVNSSCTMKIVCGEREFFDHSNGALRSNTKVHRVILPMSVLNCARKYTVVLRKVIDRKPYFPETLEEESYDYEFKPVQGTKLRIYQIADAHGKSELASLAALKAGEIDALVLNGDIPNHCGDFENVMTIYKIAEKVTGGTIPCIFSRGNHDARGYLAEEYADYTPTNYGKSYYSVKLGHVWMLIIDCGEDKDDGSIEYGNTVACHPFRIEETAYIESVIKNAQHEYLASDVTQRIVVCHVPFSKRQPAPFDIEEGIYTYWMQLLREHIKPDVMLCGHKHACEYHEPGGEYDDLGQCSPIIVGAKFDDNSYTGTYLEFDGENREILMSFTDSNGHRFGNRIIGRTE